MTGGAPVGKKKQVLGLVLVVLCLATALLARVLGFELDDFYIVFGVFGVCLFIYGSIQLKSSNRRPENI